MITLIIPTIAKPSLMATINSLLSQENKEWRAIVVFDWAMPSFDLIEDSRITYLLTPRKLGHQHAHGQAGLVRNYGIQYVTTDWVGFVDDDDTLKPDYVDHFYRYMQEKPDLDFLIFRMTHQGTIYPPHDWGQTIEECKIGISYCIRREYQQSKNIWFNNGDTEDYKFAASMRDSGCQYYVASEVTYVVKG